MPRRWTSYRYVSPLLLVLSRGEKNRAEWRTYIHVYCRMLGPAPSEILYATPEMPGERCHSGAATIGSVAEQLRRDRLQSSEWWAPRTSQLIDSGESKCLRQRPTTSCPNVLLPWNMPTHLQAHFLGGTTPTHSPTHRAKKKVFCVWR